MSDPAASPLFDYSRAFGVALHALLDTHGVTAVQLSEALGVVPETTTGWLGGAHLPGAAELPRIGATLALTVDEQADLQTAYSIAWLARRDPQNAHRLAAAPN